VGIYESPSINVDDENLQFSVNPLNGRGVLSQRTQRCCNILGEMQKLLSRVSPFPAKALSNEIFGLFPISEQFPLPTKIIPASRRYLRYC
jgi:hypothetical protein